jgi:hypothetical protein
LKAAEQVGRLVDAARVLTAGEVADRSRYELGAEGLSIRLGERKPVNVIEQVTLVSQSEASRRVRVGQAIRPRQTMLGETLPPERPIVAEAMIHRIPYLRASVDQYDNTTWQPSSRNRLLLANA